MMFLSTFFQGLTVFLSVVLVGLLLIQTRGTSGNVLGPSEGSSYRSRRGIERIFFRATIVVAVLFVGVAMATVAFVAGGQAPIETLPA